MRSRELTLSYRRVFHHEENVKGTVVTLDLFDDATPSMSSLAPIVEKALGVLHRADAMCSTWKEENCISRIRRGELLSGLSIYEGLVAASDGTFRMTPQFPLAEKMTAAAD